MNQMSHGVNMCCEAGSPTDNLYAASHQPGKTIGVCAAANVANRDTETKENKWTGGKKLGVFPTKHDFHILSFTLLLLLFSVVLTNTTIIRSSSGSSAPFHSQLPSSRSPCNHRMSPANAAGTVQWAATLLLSWCLKCVDEWCCQTVDVGWSVQ